MTKGISRRSILAGGLAAPFVAALPLRAQNSTLNVIGHRVHQDVLTGDGGAGGNIVADWTGETGVNVNWTTLDVAPLHDRILREASLQSTDFDVAFINNINATPARLGLMESLDDLMAADPVEDFEGVAPGLVAALQSGDAQKGLPMRHATTGFHYNERILAEAGLQGAPETIDAMLDTARAITENTGGRVNGLSYEGVTYVNSVTLARAWNAPFIDPQFNVIPNEEGMIRALATVRELFDAGVLPRNFPVLGQDEVIVHMQSGRAGMCYFAYGRHFQFNDPASSSEAGNIAVTAPPADPDLVPSGIVGQSEFWAMVIPANSTRKELAWSFIKSMLSPEATIRAALSGNGPVRPAAYDDARVQEIVPYAAAEARSLEVAEVPIPAFDRAIEAGDLLAQTVQLVAIGQQTPEDAVRDLKASVEALF